MKTWQDLDIDIPTGVSSVNVKTLCPKCSHLRRNRREKCLSVNLVTETFKCHNVGCDFRGSLHSGEFPAWQRPPKRIYSKPAESWEPSLGYAATEWFLSRGIAIEAVKRRKITSDAGVIRFPYYRDGELVNVKFRRHPKEFSMVADCELIFWGLDDCQTAEQVTIVEGEMDALALETAGLTNVLSVPNGAQIGGMSFLESGEAIFDRCHSVILAVDADDAGLKLEAELARRIGKEKCYRVRWPDGQKDANDVLKHLGTDVLRSSIANAEPYPIEGLKDYGDLYNGLIALKRLGFSKGDSTGWESLDHLYTVRTGQLTIVTGTPGSGKSEWLDALLVNMIRNHGWYAGIFSPENHPTESHAARIAEKWLGMPFHDGPSPSMTEMDIALVVNELRTRLTFIDPSELTLDDVLDLAGVLVFRHGIKALVIDPWGELDHARPRDLTETEYISRSLSAIRRFSRDRDVHVWLVAHPRIQRRDRDGVFPIPTPYDISGSAHWFNKADNCVTIVRDKTNETAPVQIHIQKIRSRELGRLGTCFLSYNRVVGQFRDIGRYEVSG